MDPKSFNFYFSGETERTISDSKATTATVGLVVHAAADGLALGAAGASEVSPRKKNQEQVLNSCVVFFRVIAASFLGIFCLGW